MPQPQYYRYESGQRELPATLVVKLAELYGVSTDEVLGLEAGLRLLFIGNSHTYMNDLPELVANLARKDGFA